MTAKEEERAKEAARRAGLLAQRVLNDKAVMMVVKEGKAARAIEDS